jgi:hypothetical protein
VYVGLRGIDMRSFDNLKEIIMDDSEFYCVHYIKETMSNLKKHRDMFIFHRCSTAVERVSIRNAKWYINRSNINAVSQNALIKFARNAPHLCWFRSDLTIENMNMLRLERP